MMSDCPCPTVPPAFAPQITNSALKRRAFMNPETRIPRTKEKCVKREVVSPMNAPQEQGPTRTAAELPKSQGSTTNSGANAAKHGVNYDSVDMMQPDAP